jgi:hypothetical protein
MSKHLSVCFLFSQVNPFNPSRTTQGRITEAEAGRPARGSSLGSSATDSFLSCAGLGRRSGEDKGEAGVGIGPDVRWVFTLLLSVKATTWKATGGADPLVQERLERSICQTRHGVGVMWCGGPRHISRLVKAVVLTWTWPWSSQA